LNPERQQITPNLIRLQVHPVKKSTDRGMEVGVAVVRTNNHNSGHRLTPGAKVADHGPAAEAGRRPRKNRIQTLALASLNTDYLKDTGLFRVSLEEKDNFRVGVFLVPGEGRTGTLEHLLLDAALMKTP